MNEPDRMLPADIDDVSPMISMIERVAMDPNASIEKLERMMDLRDRLQAESAKAAFSAAFSQASGAFPNIPLNGMGDKGKKYALLKDIITLTRPILSQNGLALSFGVETHPDRVIVTAELMHVDGYSKSTTMELPRDQSGSKNIVQAIGSSQTYGQRYTAQAILGLALSDDDDDGAATSTRDTITADQFFELKTLLEETGSDEAKFCAYLRAKNLEELPASQFGAAIAALRKKPKVAQ